MTDGEKMIWAAAYVQALRQICNNPRHTVSAVDQAYGAVLALREAHKDGFVSDAFGANSDVTGMSRAMLS